MFSGLGPSVVKELYIGAVKRVRTYTHFLPQAVDLMVIPLNTNEECLLAFYCVTVHLTGQAEDKRFL